MKKIDLVISGLLRKALILPLMAQKEAGIYEKKAEGDFEAFDCAEWQQMAPVYDLAVKSAMQLERITNSRNSVGLDIDELTKRLFYQSLWNVIRATKVKGMIENAVESKSTEFSGN